MFYFDILRDKIVVDTVKAYVKELFSKYLKPYKNVVKCRIYLILICLFKTATLRHVHFIRFNKNKILFVLTVEL